METRNAAAPFIGPIAVPVLGGALSAAALLAVYFGVLSILSGWGYTLSQFAQYWPYLVALAAGFGAQVGVYIYLKRLTTGHQGRGVVAASGTTSTAAMLACCTHYIANIVPLIGAAGVVTLVVQYQIELFWLGLAINAAGLSYVARQCYRARAHFAEDHPC